MASQQITGEAVYLCTGNPLPKDIEQISHWLLNESFTTSSESNLEAYYLYFTLFFLPLLYLLCCYKLPGITEMKTRKGLALVDIVREVTMYVLRYSSIHHI